MDLFKTFDIVYTFEGTTYGDSADGVIELQDCEIIADVNDGSAGGKTSLVILLKRDANANVVLNNLYKNTQLQVSFGIINLSIVNGQPRELGLLQTIKYFIEHRGATLTREELLNEVWGYHSMPSTRTVDVHVAWLRDKLKKARPKIETVWGVGYKLVPGADAS